MRKALQSDLFEGHHEFGLRRSQHGGDLHLGERKVARPFKRNTPVHIVLKSSAATGARSMRSAMNRLFVDRTFEEQAKKVEAKIHSYQNVGNHLHALVSFKTKGALRKFLRATTGLIARRLGGGLITKFWDHIPFIRIILGARDFAGVVRYIFKNKVEAEVGKWARQDLEDQERKTARERKKHRPTRARKRT